jgi:peptidoglycan hydrolase-like protein with peptidoglycan-binding domain
MEKIKRRQRLLSFLQGADGRFYYDGPIDGIDGPKTQEGAKRFLEEYGFTAAEEEADPEETGSFWDGIEYFKREEFRCKCGGLYCQGFPAEPDEHMVRYADEIRRRLGVPLHVNSGLRCKVWNQRNNGVENSQHLTGRGCDLGAPEGITPEKMASVAEEVIGNTGGIGIYPWGIHIDSRPIKSRWDYRGK